MKIIQLALVVLLGACSDFPDVKVDPHQDGPCNDPKWTMYGQPFCEAACFESAPFGYGDSSRPCAPATNPKATATHECTATIVFQGVQGCCVPHLTEPGKADEVYFYECEIQ